MFWRDREDHSDDFILIAGVVIGAVLVGLVWLVLSALTPSGESGPTANGEAAAGTASQAPLSSGPSEGGSSATDQTSYLERCREVYDAESAPLQAVGPSLGQWEVHIGAMNKLVVGAISLDQAMQFWNQTRVGAHAKLDDFAQAHRLYDQRTARCPRQGPSSDAEPGSHDCQQAVAARARAIRTATVALGTWRMHVHHMDMLRSGEMSPEEATQMWLQSWHQGVREVRDYRAAARGAEGQTC